MGREKLLRMLGELPEWEYEVSSKKIGEEEFDSFILERLVLDLNGYEPVPAIFTRPKNVKKNYPVVLYNHSHGYIYDIGKSELLNGCEYMLKKGIAYDLAKNGIGALAIDHMCFEERSGRTESSVFKTLLWKGKIMWGLMVYDSIKALDYLFTRSDIDTTRIATFGMSMGSNMSQWISALDERIKVCIDLCCLTNFEELLRTRAEDEHGYYYFVPDLYNHFSVSDINALIAPRPHLCLAGAFDVLTPGDGLKRDNETLKRVYSDLGYPSNWKLNIYNIGHMETYEMRKDSIDFLLKYL